MTKNNFNLIEILISFIVILFSLFILVSFTSISMSNARDSFNNSAVANNVDSVLDYIRKAPLDTPTSTRPIVLTDFPAPVAGIAQKPTSDTKRNDYPSFASANFDESNLVSYQTHIFENSNTDGCYLISKYSEVGGQKVKETEFEVRIWQDAVKPKSSAPDNSTWQSQGTDLSNNLLKGAAFEDAGSNQFYLYSKVTKLNVEFSWPINRPYEERIKKFFFLNITKLQNEES